MPNSKVNSEYSFNERKWVVSLINTGTGVDSVIAGHAKIIVEGIKPGDAAFFQPPERFVAEYHIMEANRVLTEEWLPQCARNTKCNYLVLMKEGNGYNQRQDLQYAQSFSKSWYVAPVAVMRMINNIYQEKSQIDAGALKNFQYAGNWCFYSYEGGHNCTTWAEEKLGVAGAGNGEKLKDSIKAAPIVHTCALC